MDKYRVRLYPKAYRDIDEIYAYIALEKMSQEKAKAQTDRIWNALSTLEQFPAAHQDRQEGRYAEKGYNTKLNLKLYHLWASFTPWRCFIPVNVALLRLPPFSLATAQNPSQI